MGSFSSHTEYTYQTLRCNVDMLRLIQLGLTFADEAGNVPEGCPTWQFNFQFSLAYVALHPPLFLPPPIHTPTPSPPGMTCLPRTASPC